jgi:integrin-linked kinase-associated serine/threonine phosphatase 2C
MSSPALEPSSPAALLEYLAQGFNSVDEQLLNECEQQNWQDGATAVAVWIVGHETALVANIGDAKCVLARAAVKVGQGRGTATQQLCG